MELQRKECNEEEHFCGSYYDLEDFTNDKLIHFVENA